MGKNAAIARMISARSTQYILNRDPIKGRLFSVLALAALAVAAHAREGIGMGEGEAVGCNADDVAVLLVELVDDEGQAARKPAECVGDLRGGPQFRAGHTAEGVEKDVVENVGSCEEGTLGSVSLVLSMGLVMDLSGVQR